MISIIIPVFNEQDSLKDLIPYLKTIIMGKDAEWIIRDGGSTDSTINICREFSTNVYTSPLRGRAAQMNYV